MKIKPNLNYSPNFFAFLLACLFFLVGFFSVLGRSPTYDESLHYLYGKQVLQGNSNRPEIIGSLDGAKFSGSLMPISALNALPKIIGDLLKIKDGILYLLFGGLVSARLVTIFISTLAALLVYKWAYSLYGFVPAIFSLLLYIFDPNIIAHSQLTTTDTYAWGTSLLVFYSAWKFANQRTWQNGLFWSLVLGISSLAKYTTIILIPLSLLAIIIYDMPKFLETYKEQPALAIKKHTGNYLTYLAGSVIISILIINIGFLFNKPFIPFGEYKFSSHLLNGIQTRYPFLNNVPVPVPFPYVEGFDLTYYYGEEGRAYGNIYLLGELRNGKYGFKGYYLVASFFKTPIATQIITLSAFILYFTRKKYRQSFFSDDIFMFLPILFFTIYFNFLFNINNGIRYYLVLFPLLFVFCGSLFTGWNQFSKTQKTLSMALAAYLIVSTLSYFPHFIPYFNEFLTDRRQAYKILADSNLDWGQDEYILEDFLASHPDAVYNPEAPTSGLIVASVNELVGVLKKPEKYTWLRENFEPDETLAYTYLVYHISTEELETLCQTTEYCK